MWVTMNPHPEQARGGWAPVLHLVSSYEQSRELAIFPKLPMSSAACCCGNWEGISGEPHLRQKCFEKCSIQKHIDLILQQSPHPKCEPTTLLVMPVKPAYFQFLFERKRQSTKGRMPDGERWMSALSNKVCVTVSRSMSNRGIAYFSGFSPSAKSHNNNMA